MMLSLPKYDCYKDSGVDWLGEIPVHWKILPLTKYMLSQVDYRGKTPEKVDQGVFLVTAKNIKDGYVDYEISREFVRVEHYQQIMSRGKPKINDLLFTTEAPLGEVALVDKENIALAQRIIKFRVKDKFFLPNFVRYSMLSFYFRNYLAREATGSTVKGIKASKLHKLKIITPSLEEQEKIVKFLDRKCDEVERSIELKQKLITLLDEQKSIVINQGVTKGLNPHAPMKDSGIDWLGDIPAHWEVLRAKYLLKEVDERSQTGKEELLSVSHVTGITPRSEKNVNMFMAEDYTGSKLCRENDLVINIMWAWMGALGVSNQLGIISSSYAVFRQKKPDTFNAWFLEHLLRSTQYVAQYNRVSTGLHSSRLRLYADTFLTFPIIFPTKQEQDLIEKKVREKIAEIEELKEKTLQQIEKLKEFKQILIAEAVTGKIKV